MNPLTPKIALIISACLLGMNFVAGAAIAVGPCPPSICCGDSMHHYDIINFAQPVQKKCCDECDDAFCGLQNDPLKDVKPVPPSPEMGYSQTFYVANAPLDGITCRYLLETRLSHFLSVELVSHQTPLYIAHLSLII